MYEDPLMNTYAACIPHSPYKGRKLTRKETALRLTHLLLCVPIDIWQPHFSRRDANKYFGDILQVLSESNHQWWNIWRHVGLTKSEARCLIRHCDKHDLVELELLTDRIRISVNLLPHFNPVGHSQLWGAQYMADHLTAKRKLSEPAKVLVGADWQLPDTVPKEKNPKAQHWPMYAPLKKQKIPTKVVKSLTEQQGFYGIGIVSQITKKKPQGDPK